ncbi:hypothetical protein KR093_011822 [Drosophila rubida]|uniref:Trichohyalin n=1 Tax=Drosophila rubida TaxID=30044 RepID=A0AAD4PQN1_9MUSC|nr:hypothetical protein KR093_011822 [Drosophila rubida]
MTEAQLHKLCLPKPGHTAFIKNRTVRPVVISANRFNAVVRRSRMADKQEMKAADEEEQRYMEYLKEGSDRLCSHFKNMGGPSFDEEQQARLDQELREDEVRKAQVKKEDEQSRKERIMRANRILENLKSGQRALHHALVESELAYQRHFNEALNREIAKDARQQQELDDARCPEMLIPFGGVTEEQEKTVQEQKATAIREYFQKELAEREQQRLEQKEKEDSDVIIERAQYKCLQDQEQRAAKRLAESKREFCRRAYKDALEEKARIANFENICDKIDDRLVCVAQVTRRKLDVRSDRIVQELCKTVAQEREERAIQQCRLQQAQRQQDKKERGEVVALHDARMAENAEQRLRRVQQLSKERVAYEKQQRLQLREKQKREAQIQRFHVAERFKNSDTNANFAVAQKRRRVQDTENLRRMLQRQRDECVERRDAELLQVSACAADPYLQQDVSFFEDAVNMITHAKEGGRPIYPLAKAVELYRRKNGIEVATEGRTLRRSRQRDNCWPGYHGKADVNYRKYEQQEQCRQQQEASRHGIFTKCIKITKMATEEQPYKKCALDCPMKCVRHRGLPAISDVDSFDCGSNVLCVHDPRICELHQ